MGAVKELEKEIDGINTSIKQANGEIAKWRAIKQDLEVKKAELNKKIHKLNADRVSSVDWSGSKYPWSEEVIETLKTRFLIDSFRPQQLSVINATLSGSHAIVVMPTGAGKSLCYQLPALIKPGVTIVISPLISLMEDQVRSLTRKNIPAKLITSGMPKEESNSAFNVLKDNSSPVHLIYVTPERLAKSKRFMAALQKCHSEGRLQRIAIDEVHCCSQWGHDFRPDYKFLGILSNMFRGVPILGLTATATAHVLSDVQEILNIQGCLVIKAPFNRPNLFYKILEKPTAKNQCLDIIENLLKTDYKGESGIIYTNSVKDCIDVAQGLRERGLKVGKYHAQDEAETRAAVHIKWHENYYQAIVATVAFGMGIDKPDVRFVIHHTISKSMENYYQESGRAGRDGKKADCITLYRMQDIFNVSKMVFSSVGSLKHLYGMAKYCLTSFECRRSLISKHFDEDWGDGDCNKMCDVCCIENNKMVEVDITAHCKAIGDIYRTSNQELKLTAQKLLDMWYKIREKVNKKGKSLPKDVGEDMIVFLLLNDYLVEDFHYTSYTTISYLNEGPQMIQIDNPDFKLKMPLRKVDDSSVSKVNKKRQLSDKELSGTKAKKIKMVHNEAT